MKDELHYALKSVGAFFALVATNVATRWVTNSEPLPQTLNEWGTFTLTSLGGTWLVWQLQNGPKPKRRRSRRTAPTSTAG